MAVVTFGRTLGPLAVGIALVAALAPSGDDRRPRPPPTSCCSTRRILTVDDAFRTVAALAVRDGRFVAVGSNDEVRRLRRRHARG